MYKNDKKLSKKTNYQKKNLLFFKTTFKTLD
jgi:hypothetical protein